MKPWTRHALAAFCGLLLAAGNGRAADGPLVLQIAPGASEEGSLAWELYTGAEIYFEDVNERGGIEGKPITLLPVEQAEDLPAQLRQLVRERNPVALFGTVGAAPVEKLLAARALDESQLPLVGPYTGVVAADARQAGNVFLTRASYGSEIEKVVAQFSAMGIRKLAMVYGADATGRELLALAKTQAGRRGQEIVFAQPDPLQPAKCAALADAVLASEHHAVILALPAEGAAAFAKRYRERGGAGQLVLLSVVGATRFAELAGAQVAHGAAVVQVVPRPRNTSLAVVREFNSNYRKYGPYTEEPTEAMMLGYLSAKVLVEGLRKGGSSGRAALLRTLPRLSGYDAGGVSFDFSSASRVGSRYLELSVIDRQGHIVH
ncbi:ABC transporter substrate-binding protein [Niveibacterium sp. SC-1]|uniref:ABC transporter substrate-binding protein n=1 Tax=Niveibacterium sp. SC-1 TaxID=3135646 RepID=UPI00311ED2EB